MPKKPVIDTSELERRLQKAERDIIENAARITALEGQTPVEPPVEPPSGDRNYRLQAGPWQLAGFNPDDPFINLIWASRADWRVPGHDIYGGYDSADLLMRDGFIRDDGLPKAIPSNQMRQNRSYLKSADDRFHGAWLLLWDTLAGPGAADIRHTNDLDWTLLKSGRARIVIRPEDYENPNFHGLIIRINRLDTPLTELALIREEDEVAYNSGQIYRNEFIDRIKNYDVVRVMDWMRSGNSFIRKHEDQAESISAFWSEMARGREYPPARRAAPMSAMINLAVQTYTALWYNVPATLGAPEDFDLNDLRYEPSNVVAFDVESALESEHWDRYARKFISLLTVTGYPIDRELIISIGNEMWNWSSYYNATTAYAAHIGRYFDREGDQISRGYGILLGRLYIAFRNALAIHNREQKITFAVERHQVWSSSTRIALAAMREYVESKGIFWDNIKRYFAGSIAHYWAIFFKSLPNTDRPVSSSTKSSTKLFTILFSNRFRAYISIC